MLILKRKSIFIFILFFLLIIGFSFYLIWRFKGQSGLFPLFYNPQTGITKLGFWWEYFEILALSLIILIINFFISLKFYQRKSIYYTILGTTVLNELIIFISLIYLLNLWF